MLIRPASLKTLFCSRRGPIFRIALNRPRVGNRVNRQMAQDLAEVAASVNQEDSIRVVIISGRGKAFSSGWEGLRIRSYQEMSTYLAAASVASIERPVVAAINGDAVGQGLELTLAADLRIAAQGARFGLPHVNRGVIPWDGGTQRLARLIGPGRAMEILLTGELIDAQEAKRIGLISRLVKPDGLRVAVDSVAAQIAQAAPIAARYAKEAVVKGMDISLDQGMHLEADLSILLHSTRDRAEGIRSFLERRSPRFRGK